MAAKIFRVKDIPANIKIHSNICLKFILKKCLISHQFSIHSVISCLFSSCLAVRSHNRGAVTNWKTKLQHNSNRMYESSKNNNKRPTFMLHIILNQCCILRRYGIIFGRLTYQHICSVDEQDQTQDNCLENHTDQSTTGKYYLSYCHTGSVRVCKLQNIMQK